MDKSRRTQRRRIMVATGVTVAAAGVATMLGRRHVFDSYPRGAPLVIDTGNLQEGRLRTLDWAGKPVWVLRRSGAEIESLASHESLLTDPHSRQSIQPGDCVNQHRSARAEIFVAIGLCTHQGCSPALASGSFLCPCHASKFDLAGRVFTSGPATTNLVIPAYHFEANDRLVVGTEA